MNVVVTVAQTSSVRDRSAVDLKTSVLRPLDRKGIQIRDLSILRSGDINLLAGSVEDSRLLRQHFEDWAPALGQGVTLCTSFQANSVVAHGALKTASFKDELKARIQEEYGAVKSIDTLPGRIAGALVGSLIITFMDPVSTTSFLSRDRFVVQSKELRLVRWNPALRASACGRCGSWKHGIKGCKETEPRCLKCAGEHSTSTCVVATLLCLHCKGNHATVHRVCPEHPNHIAPAMIVEPAAPVSTTPPPRAAPPHLISTPYRPSLPVNSFIPSKPHRAATVVGPTASTSTSLGIAINTPIPPHPPHNLPFLLSLSPSRQTSPSTWRKMTRTSRPTPPSTP